MPLAFACAVPSQRSSKPRQFCVGEGACTRGRGQGHAEAHPEKQTDFTWTKLNSLQLSEFAMDGSEVTASKDSMPRASTPRER